MQKKSDSVSFYLCIGTLVGVAIGCWIKNLGLGIAICTLVGILVGIIKDKHKKL